MGRIENSGNDPPQVTRRLSDRPPRIGVRALP